MSIWEDEWEDYEKDKYDFEEWLDSLEGEGTDEEKYNKYQKAEYSEYYRKKVYRKIKGITNYNLNDVFIFSDVLKYDPALLLFGVQ